MRIAIVGGIPNPIGGVTTFISRLISTEKSIKFLFDLYPSKTKRLPRTYSDSYICSRYKALTLAKLFLFCTRARVDVVHFNFSSPRSFLLLLFLPKRSSVKWYITLHHGDLGQPISFTRILVARKLDGFLSLNPRQEAWYKKSFPRVTVINSSSYVKPSPPLPSTFISSEIASLKANYKRLFVCSGYPKEIYNHLLTIELMSFFPNDVLVCCLYGTGELDEAIVNASQCHNNVFIVRSLSEDDFNFTLLSADLYLRLNTEDSFGIAVADAINFETLCVCTDVCPRYPGAFLVSLPLSLEDVASAINSALKGQGLITKTIISEFNYDFLMLETKKAQ